MTEHDFNELARKIDRDIPESFWDVWVWQDFNHGHNTTGSLDVADRRSIILRVLELAEKHTRQKRQDTEPETKQE